MTESTKPATRKVTLKPEFFTQGEHNPATIRGLEGLKLRVLHGGQDTCLCKSTVRVLLPIGYQIGCAGRITEGPHKDRHYLDVPGSLVSFR